MRVYASTEESQPFYFFLCDSDSDKVIWYLFTYNADNGALMSHGNWWDAHNGLIDTYVGTVLDREMGIEKELTRDLFSMIDVLVLYLNPPTDCIATVYSLDFTKMWNWQTWGGGCCSVSSSMSTLTENIYNDLHHQRLAGQVTWKWNSQVNKIFYHSEIFSFQNISLSLSRLLVRDETQFF